ncbi:MAG: PucR family transcriptional regulator ligand-binding domain-containing protein [Bacillota bacterium]
MSFTLENILTIKELNTVQLAAGKLGITRAVKWVTILEVLDELSFLDEGDLLVTTGYGLAEDKTLQEQLIPFLAEKNLAGLAIQPGFSIKEIPEIIMQKAEEYNFPVLHLPKDLSFGKFTRHILRHLINHQFYMLEYSQKIYNQLTRIVLNNQGLESIAESLVNIINRPVLFLDLFHKTLAMAEPDEKQSAPWGKLQPLIQKASSRPGNQTAVINAGDHGQLVITPITTGSEVLGFLCVLNLKPPLEEMENIAIGHAATLAALLILKDMAVRETENRLKEDFLEETLKGNYLSPQVLAKKAAAFGYDHYKGYYLLLIHLQNWAKLTSVMEDKETYNLKSRILSGIESCMSKHGLRYMHKFSHDKLLVLVQAKNEQSLDKIKSIAQDVVECLMSIDYNFELNAGLSNFYDQLEKLSQAHQEAGRAVELGKSFQKRLTLFSEIEVYNLFYEVAKQQVSRKFYEDNLGLLEQYDKKNNSNLVATLIQFLESNCNLQETSSKLFIHRHTLKYRLQRIKEITKLDPLKGEDRLKLQVCLLLSKMIQKPVTME